MGGFLNQLFGNGNIGWVQDMISSLLPTMNSTWNQGETAVQNATPSMTQPEANYLPSTSQDLAQYVLGGGGQPGIANTIGAYNQSIPGLGQGFLGNGQALQGLTNTNLLNASQQMGNNIYAGVGQEQQLGGYQNGALQSMAQTNTPGVAGQILDALTYNAPTQYGQGFSAINNLLGTGGVASGNAMTSALQNYALQTAGQGGMTNTLNMALNPIQSILNSQGNTGASNELVGQGSNLFNQQALMSPTQAAGLAGNLASTATQDQAQQAEQNALARGGGAGATVANGMTNQSMADFANQIAQNTSQASSQALQNQQALQLQQQGMGANAVGQGGGLANTLYNNGLSQIPGVQNSATNYLNAYLNGGLGAGGLANSGTLGSINALGSLAGTQGNEALGMGNLQNSIAQGLGSLTNQSMSNQNNLVNMLGNLGLGTGQLGTGQFSALTGAQNAGLNTGLGAGNLLNNTFNTYMNPLQTVYQGGITQTGQGIQGMGSLMGGANAAAQPSTGITGILGLLGGIASSIRYKDNVKPMTDEEVASLDKLKPVTFDYKLDHVDIPGKQYGLIAEQVDEVLPDIVIHKNGQAEAINYQPLIALLLAKVQKLEKRVQDLEGK